LRLTRLRHGRLHGKANFQLSLTIEESRESASYDGCLVNLHC